LAFQVFLIMLTIGSLLRALVKFRRRLRAGLPRAQPSPWEVRGNFVLICLGLSVIAVMLAFSSIDLAHGYLVGLLIGLAITVMLVPTSWAYKFGLDTQPTVPSNFLGCRNHCTWPRHEFFLDRPVPMSSKVYPPLS
jgi:hypothetical protein